MDEGKVNGKIAEKKKNRKTTTNTNRGNIQITVTLLFDFENVDNTSI
jgi:hypothetical protein